MESQTGLLYVPLIESVALVDETKVVGIKNIVVNHPVAAIMGTTEEQQREVAMKGAYLSFCYTQTVSDGFMSGRTKQAVRAIKTIGTEHCCLSTDSRNNLFPLSVEALRTFTQIRMALGCYRRRD